MMDDKNGYAVFFFPQALEALGDAIKPYLQGEPGGEHVVCREIDTGGSLIEMTLDGQTTQGQAIALELMLPTSMVRMIVSARSDEEAFGFGPRIPVAAIAPVADAAEAPAPAPAPVPANPKPQPSPPSPAEAPSKTLPESPPPPEAAPPKPPKS